MGPIELQATRDELEEGLEVEAGGSYAIRLKPGAWLTNLTGMYFETNKCFLLPSAMKYLRALKVMYDQYPKAKVLVVGHTDTARGGSGNVGQTRLC